LLVIGATSVVQHARRYPQKHPLRIPMKSPLRTEMISPRDSDMMSPPGPVPLAMGLLALSRRSSMSC
jgi:hypothetical protein